ncbi:MAG: hypothetical protein Q9191_002826 [Dirinaria sp. TL-2023a]
MSHSNYRTDMQKLHYNHVHRERKCMTQAPQDVFPFFGLPKEIRYMILELLLVRGQVALCPDSEIKRRFPTWKQKRPEWAVRAVNRQMRAEAGDIVFSSRNTFFVPNRGSNPSCQVGWSYWLPWPPIRSLDCGFTLCDIPHSHSASISDFAVEKAAYDREFGTGAFESLPHYTKLSILHERKLVGLRSSWLSLVEAILGSDLPLELLRLDLTDCRCPIGCCWLGLDVATLFDSFSSGWFPKRTEIIGVPPHEHVDVKNALTEGCHERRKDIFFVDRQRSLLGAIAEEPVTDALSRA